MGPFREKLAKAEAFCGESRYLEATQLAQEILAEDDRCAPAYALLGKVYALQLQWDDALSELDRALELDPGLAAAYLQRGSIRLMAGELETAGADMGRAVELDPALEGQANLIVQAYADIVRKEQRRKNS
jgi:tetratricopeptide (TPR) repeat protein